MMKYICFMRYYILTFLILLLPIYSYAQSENPSDTIRVPSKQYKQYGDFILDMSLFSLMPPTIPKVSLELPKPSINYNELLQLDKMPVFDNFYSSYSLSHFDYYHGMMGTPVQLQSKSYRLNDNLRLNTYGQYDEYGRKIPNPGALPWEKNNFVGGFELKSNKGFGIRVEVRQGNRNPYAPPF